MIGNEYSFVKCLKHPTNLKHLFYRLDYLWNSVFLKCALHTLNIFIHISMSAYKHSCLLFFCLTEFFLSSALLRHYNSVSPNGNMFPKKYFSTLTEIFRLYSFYNGLLLYTVHHITAPLQCVMPLCLGF